MKHDKKKDDLKIREKHKNMTDPQENEKDHNVFGAAFDKVFGNAEGGGSIDDSEQEPKRKGNKK